MLIEQGAEINTGDGVYPSPLHLASRMESAWLVNYLIENGADINATYQCHHRFFKVTGTTALHIAANKGNQEIATILIQHGSKLNPIENTTWLDDIEMPKTPVFCAARGYHIKVVDLLIRSGANPYIKCEGKKINLFPMKHDEIILSDQVRKEFYKTHNWRNKIVFWEHYPQDKIEKKKIKLVRKFDDTVKLATDEINQTIKIISGGKIPKLYHLAFLTFWKQGIPLDKQSELEQEVLKNIQTEIFSKVPGTECRK